MYSTGPNSPAVYEWGVYSLINRYVFEKNIIDEIAKNLIQRYILLYYNLEEKENINREQFNIKKLNLVLETFYS